ncbi:unnamed protein product [Gongylonema pulchrum]|uniref:CAS_CSE1 domain-containing protein n=1 Tax=Gongylonema pulchrum TaxID=637853 RepID=A0A183DRJ7_9BILA|nr:unnamed protein product [Gongylonema pulchrum]
MSKEMQKCQAEMENLRNASKQQINELEQQIATKKRETHVRGDLFHDDVNALPILKADALKYVVVFRNQLQPEQLIEIVNASPKYANCLSFSKLKILINRENVPVGPLIVALFACFEASSRARNSHYLMKALMRCFNIIDVETAKSSGQIVDKLATMIAVAVKNPVDPVHLHYVFESLCVLIKQVYTIVDGGIDKHVVPLIENIFSSDAVDFIPYALQITSLLLDQAQAQKLKGGTSYVDSYLPFFENLMKEELWLRTANIPAALLVFFFKAFSGFYSKKTLEVSHRVLQVVESFLRSHTEHILKNYANILLAIFQKLIGSKALDQHGFQLANTFLNYIGQTDVITEPALLIPMLRRVQFSKTTKFMKSFVLFLARFVIVRGVSSLYQALESIQTGMYMMVVEKIIISELEKMHNTTTYEEKRICCVGFANLLAETVDKLGFVDSC